MTTDIALPTERLIGRIEGAIGWMIFNNPARRNAVSLDMWAAMPLLLDAFEKNPDVRVIVLRGAGNHAFVAGADISEFEQLRATPEAVAAYDGTMAQAGKRLSTTGKPTIAMIHGFCIGGGLGIAVECDLRIADTAATFAIPAARLGLGYDPVGVKSLLDLVGPAFVKEIFYTARQFTAEEALAMGLVNRVVAEAELEGLVRKLCAGIADNAPLTMLSVKRTVSELLRTSSEVDMAFCDRVVADCFASEDYREGRRAFMEKRRPVFKGE